MMAVLAVVVGVLVLVIAVGGYAVAGFVVATNRVSSADHAIKSAASHQTDFSQSMSDIGAGFSSVDSSSFDSKAYKSQVDHFVQVSQAAADSTGADSAKVESAAGHLHDSDWLTVFSRGQINGESAKIEHARKALSAARTLANGFVQDGQFFEAFAAALVDLDTIATQAQGQNYVAASAAVSQLKTDLATSLTLTSSPGLSADVHTFIVDFQKLAADFEVALNAVANKDQTAYDKANAAFSADLAALNAISPSNLGSAMETYYRPYINTYQTEMRLATG